MARRIVWLVAATLIVGVLAVAVPAAAGKNCKCRAGGENFEQGQITCIRGKLARCEMFLNNSSWKVIAEICPQSSLPPLPLLMAHLRAMQPPRSMLPSC